MLRTAPLLLLLNGCMLFATGDPSHVTDAPESMKEQKDHVPPVYDTHPFGSVEGITVGEWAKYRVGEQILTLSAVAREGESLWIEVAEDGDSKTASARLVSPDGEILKAFYRRLPDGAVRAQPLLQTPVKDGVGRLEVDREVADEEVAIGDRAISGKKVRITWEDLDGRRTVDEATWSAEVPGLFASSEFGGLVRRAGVELLGHGTDAVRRVVPPR